MTAAAVTIAITRPTRIPLNVMSQLLSREPFCARARTSLARRGDDRAMTPQRQGKLAVRITVQELIWYALQDGDG
jgi:hypothetical protein